MKLTKKLKKMKTLLHLTAFATLIVAFSFNLNASNINLVPEDEAYINDIPFSTEVVVANYLYNKALHETFEFEEEEYIDDIPFDTEAVVETNLLNETVNVELNLIK